MRARCWLAVVLAVHLCLGALYAWATPILEAPDEGADFVTPALLRLDLYF